METTALDILRTLILNNQSTANEDQALLTSLYTKYGQLDSSDQICLHQQIVNLMETRRTYAMQLNDLQESSKNLLEPTQEKVDAGMPSGLFVSLRQIALPETQKAVYNDLVDQLELLLKTNGKIYTWEDVAAQRLQDPQPVKVDLNTL